MGQMKDTHLAIAGIIVSAARIPTRSGTLAATVRPGATRAAAIARAGNNRKRGGVAYSNPIHWGWFKRGIKPQPFLSYAAQRSEPRWFAVYTADIEKILSRIEGK